MEGDAEWMPPGIAQPAAADPAAGRRSQGVGGALHRGALHVVKDAANSPHLFAAAGTPRPAVDERGKRRSVPGRFLCTRTIHDQDAAMVRRQAKYDFGGEGIVGGKYR